LSIKGRRLWCHWLGVEDYEAVADPTDYRAPKGATLLVPEAGGEEG